ncbi:MAG TPA: glycoside hydrolase family 13 protein [Burkholderiaceae bacterium]
MLRKLFAALLLGTALHTYAAPIERIEPPSWWIGMRSNKLQLMVHGTNIADYVPELHYPGVRIAAVTAVPNRNYLFVDLVIDHEARAGMLDLVFRHGDQSFSYPYALQTREKGSAERKSFASSDAILNLMPDRFANGNPANDTVAGYPDKLDRADDDAGRHGGDIAGMAAHLDYIAAMGYTMIWPTPLVEDNQPRYSYHGYAATDTYKIDPRFGSNEEYKRFVAQAKQKGLGVIQDVVLNHIGSAHWWMKDMPMQDWISYDGKFVPTLHAHGSVADPYASQEDKTNFVSGWFTENMPDMNQKNPFVATYQTQNAIWWIEYAGLSGLRVDTYSYSDPEFLAAWSRRIGEEYPNLNVVGEEWNNNPVAVAYWQRGKQNANGYRSYLPSLMDFPLNETLRSTLAHGDEPGSNFRPLYDLLYDDTLYPDPMNLVVFEGNHDENRLFTTVGEDIGLYKIALSYIATMRGIPQFYYGTEVLMKSKNGARDDGAARRDFPGGWAGDKVNAFTGQGLTAQQREAQDFMRKLLNWRKNEGVIHHGKLMHYTPERGTYVYFRYDTKNTVMVALNQDKAEAALETRRFREMLSGHASGTDVITGKTYDLADKLVVPARTALILEIK